MFGGGGTGYCPSDVTTHIHTNSRHYIVGAILFRGSICATKYNLIFQWYHVIIKIYRKVVPSMPKKTDDSLKTDSGLYKSKIKASKQYDKNNVDNIRVRVPKGWKEQMQDYVKTSSRYDSVNGMICDLIQNEVEIKD